MTTCTFDLFHERAWAALRTLLEQLLGGRLEWNWTSRLMLCVGVAAVASEVLPLQRSYWVVLTVVIVVKPDNGSVFARALQRGIGTIIGAELGAVILAAVPYGPWLLFPMAVLLAGYAPWPSSWHSYLPRQFAATLRDICRFMEAELISDPDPAARDRGWQLRRQAHRALGDLHGEYQRAMSQPAAVSRRASAWWPAIVALDEVVDVALKPVTDAVRPVLSVLGSGPQPARPEAAVT